MTYNMQVQDPAVKAHWASVNQCVAWPDGAAEIIHENGIVEHIGSNGRRFAISRLRTIPIGRFKENGQARHANAA
jgi:hypothetical protein